MYKKYSFVLAIFINVVILYSDYKNIFEDGGLIEKIIVYCFWFAILLSLLALGLTLYWKRQVSVGKDKNIDELTRKNLEDFNIDKVKNIVSVIYRALLVIILIDYL